MSSKINFSIEITPECLEAVFGKKTPKFIDSYSSCFSVPVSVCKKEEQPTNIVGLKNKPNGDWSGIVKNIIGRFNKEDDKKEESSGNQCDLINEYVKLSKNKDTKIEDWMEHYKNSMKVYSGSYTPVPDDQIPEMVAKMSDAAKIDEKYKPIIDNTVKTVMNENFKVEDLGKIALDFLKVMKDDGNIPKKETKEIKESKNINDDLISQFFNVAGIDTKYKGFVNDIIELAGNAKDEKISELIIDDFFKLAEESYLSKIKEIPKTEMNYDCEENCKISQLFKQFDSKNEDQFLTSFDKVCFFDCQFSCAGYRFLQGIFSKYKEQGIEVITENLAKIVVEILKKSESEKIANKKLGLDEIFKSDSFNEKAKEILKNHNVNIKNSKNFIKTMKPLLLLKIFKKESTDDVPEIETNYDCKGNCEISKVFKEFNSENEDQKQFILSFKKIYLTNCEFFCKASQSLQRINDNLNKKENETKIEFANETEAKIYKVVLEIKKECGTKSCIKNMSSLISSFIPKKKGEHPEGLKQMADLFTGGSEGSEGENKIENALTSLLGMFTEKKIKINPNEDFLSSIMDEPQPNEQEMI